MNVARTLSVDQLVVVVVLSSVELDKSRRDDTPKVLWDDATKAADRRHSRVLPRKSMAQWRPGVVEVTSMETLQSR